MVCHVLIDARLMGWFGASLYTLPWVSPNITKLSLSAIPYSITSSAKVDGLWSSVFYLYLFNCIYSGIRKRHLWMFPRAPCINFLNTCHIPTWSASRRRCRFIFHAPFNSIYISVFFFFFILPILLPIQRERAYCSKNFVLVFFLLPFVESITFSRDRLLGKSSLLFSYLSFYYCTLFGSVAF